MDGYSIPLDLFNFIKKNLPEGATLLELGSGAGSAELCKYYKLYSVEHAQEWVNKYPGVNYIYAPLKSHKQVAKLTGTEWYDWSYVKPAIKNLDYQMILIDGPPICHGRAGFAKYLDHFKIVPMVFDDLHRGRDLQVALKVSRRLQESITIIPTEEGRSWGYIWPKGSFAKQPNV